LVLPSGTKEITVLNEEIDVSGQAKAIAKIGTKTL
jgi:hypothetical protein